MEENDLEAQMKMLEGLGSLDIAADATTVGTPFMSTPESVNTGIPQIMQEQANAQAAAQVVYQTTTIPIQQNTVVKTPVAAPIQPVQQPVNPVATPVQPIQAVVQQPVQPVQNVVQDFSAFEGNDEPVFATLGQDTTDERLPFINLKPGEATRVMIFTLDMLPVFTHYVEGLGYFRCKSKRDNGFITLKCPCCEFTTDEGKPIYAKERKILPVIEYPVSKDGKSLLAGKQPQLKFLVLSKRDMQSLNTILSPEVVQDKAKLTQVLGMDFSVKIEEGDTYKTKLIASTFDTIRTQFPGIAEEIKKYSRDILVQARDERFRDVPVESMQAALDKERADRLAAQTIAATPIPPASMLGI